MVVVALSRHGWIFWVMCDNLPPQPSSSSFHIFQLMRGNAFGCMSSGMTSEFMWHVIIYKSQLRKNKSQKSRESVWTLTSHSTVSKTITTPALEGGCFQWAHSMACFLFPRLLRIALQLMASKLCSLLGQISFNSQRWDEHSCSCHQLPSFFGWQV